MLINFSHSTQQYHKGILALIMVSMILIMFQVSQHGLMLQEKLSIQNHCPQQTQNLQQLSEQLPEQQCQTFLSTSDTLNTHSNLSANLADASLSLFSTAFPETLLKQSSNQKLAVYMLAIKTYPPSIIIKFHSLLI